MMNKIRINKIATSLTCIIDRKMTRKAAVAAKPHFNNNKSNP